MWNPVKIFKLTRVLWKRGAGYDNTSLQAAATVAVELNGQFEFPSNLKLVTHYRKTEKGRDILWGRRNYSKEHQRDVIIPRITDQKTMEAMAPNTVGGHYQHLLESFGTKGLQWWGITGDMKFAPIYPDTYSYVMIFNIFCLGMIRLRWVKHVSKLLPIL